MKTKINKKTLKNKLLKNLSINNTLLNQTINNKYVLYIVAFISLITILNYIINKNFSAFIFFYLIAMITFYFNKNMTVVLLTSIIITYILELAQKYNIIKEGLNHPEDDDSESSMVNKPKKRKKNNKPKEVEEDLELDLDEEDMEQDMEEDMEEEMEDMDLTNLKEEAEKMNEKDSYQNIKLNPSLYNTPNKNSINKKPTKADKMERAYDDLEKVIGKDGIQSVSDSTKGLVKQQKELLNGLKEVTPALNDAMKAVGKIDMSSLTTMFNGLKNVQD